MKTPLFDDFYVRELSQEEFAEIWDRYEPIVFNRRQVTDVQRLMSETEIAQSKELAKHMGSPLCLRFGVFKGKEFVGWHVGDQKSREELYMRNTGILPEYQNRGIYTAFLKIIMKEAAERGFQVVSSKHHPTNGRVLVAKLKAGFIIAGFELSDKFGTLVRLEYFTNKDRRAIMDYRCGYAPLPEHLCGAIKNS